MFGKKKNEMKLMEGDVGFAEDSFSAMKQAVGNEEHYFCDFTNSGDEEDDKKYNDARKIRSDLQDSIIKIMNTKLKAQEWCKIKHTCGMAMHIQELLARVSSVGGIKEVSDKLRECHQLLYLEYLRLLGINEKNMKISTGA